MPSVWEFGNDEFRDRFEVYSHSEDSVKRLISPDFMAALLKVRKMPYARRVRFYVNGDVFILTIEPGPDLSKPVLRVLRGDPPVTADGLREAYDELYDVLEIVNRL